MTSLSARAGLRARPICIALIAATACTFAPAQAGGVNPNIGHLTGIHDRSGDTAYSYDLFGHVTEKRQTLANGFAQQISYTYLPTGLLANIDYPGGGVLAYYYDNTGRLTELDWNGQPLVTKLSWNPMGQPLSWRWAFASPNIFASRSYDTAARLTATEFSSYVYDAAGHVTYLSQQLVQPADANPANSTIASSNVGWSVAYDATGRITGFNATGNTAQFSYDANGMGGAKSTGSTQYIYLPTANGAMPIAAVINGQIYAVHSDHLNTPRRIDNASGQTVWQWAYSAFGDDEPTTAATRFTGPNTVPTTGTTTATPIVFNLRFPGQYYDAESGLHYNGKRSYRPADGGYTQVDPIGLNGGWNPRAYADGNALNFSDPTGLLKVCAIPGGCMDTSPPPPVSPDSPYASGSPGFTWPKLVPQPWVDSIRDVCGNIADRLKNWVLSDGQRPSKTPNTGAPGSTVVNPGSGQQRGYGDDGQPAWDVDWDQHHGPNTPVPHGHDWGRDANGRPTRGEPVPIQGPWQPK